MGTMSQNLNPQKDNMDTISIRYGEDVTLPIDAADTTAVSADIFIGNPGETYILTENAVLTNGVGVFELTALQTEIPLGTYSYQLNVYDVNGKLKKYPAPEGECDSCDGEFPKFIVGEALDQIEVS